MTKGKIYLDRWYVALLFVLRCRQGSASPDTVTGHPMGHLWEAQGLWPVFFGMRLVWTRNPLNKLEEASDPVAHCYLFWNFIIKGVHAGSTQLEKARERENGGAITSFTHRPIAQTQVLLPRKYFYFLHFLNLYRSFTCSVLLFLEFYI